MTSASEPLPLDVPEPHWRLDERSRQIGRNGLAAARAALEQAARRAAA
jgi:hypothetical protein